MKKYMVVYVIDGEENAWFSDDKEKAEQFRMDVSCGMGGYAEVYERMPETEVMYGAYEFSYA